MSRTIRNVRKKMKGLQTPFLLNYTDLSHLLAVIFRDDKYLMFVKKIISAITLSIRS